jgi:hypothetical protein
VEKITVIDKDAVLTLGALVLKNLESLSTTTGLKFRCDGGMYGGTFGSFKLEFATVSDEVVNTPEVVDFRKYHERYVLPQLELERAFFR